MKINILSNEGAIITTIEAQGSDPESISAEVEIYCAENNIDHWDGVYWEESAAPKPLEDWTPEEIAAKEAELKAKWIDSGKAREFSGSLHRKVAHHASLLGNKNLFNQAKARII